MALRKAKRALVPGKAGRALAATEFLPFAPRIARGKPARLLGQKSKGGRPTKKGDWREDALALCIELARYEVHNHDAAREALARALRTSPSAFEVAGRALRAEALKKIYLSWHRRGCPGLPPKAWRHGYRWFIHARAAEAHRLQPHRFLDARMVELLLEAEFRLNPALAMSGGDRPGPYRSRRLVVVRG